MMHTSPTRLLASASLLALVSTAGAQDLPSPLINGGKGKADIVYKDISLKLTLDSRDARVKAADANGLVHVFDLAMHAECAFFQTPCPSTVILSIVTPAEFRCGSAQEQAGCAFVDDSDPSIRRIHINGDYLATTPAYDVVAHEAMHLLQGSPDATDCDYWHEGEADLARFYWGGSENQAASGFTLPEPGGPWEEILTDSRAAGAFLVWFHQNWGDESLLAFHAFIESHTCPGDEFWKAQTGFQGFEAMWAAYAKGEQPNLHEPEIDKEQPAVREEQPADDDETFEP